MTNPTSPPPAARERARAFISEHRHGIKLQLLADAENELAALLTEERTKALEEAAVTAEGCIRLNIPHHVGNAIRSLKAEGGEI